MTVGKSGELKIACGGMDGLYVTVAWAERMDAAANASVLSVTGVTVDGGGRIGRVTVGGTVSVNGSVIARLSEDTHWAEITQFGVPAAESNGAYPFLSEEILHAADGTGTAVLTVQLSGGHGESGQRFYASASLTVVLTDLARVSAVTAVCGAFGEPVTVLITAPASTLRHTLRYVCGTAEGIIGTELGEGSHVWTPPVALCAEVPNSLSADCTIHCDTYRGDVLVGSSAYSGRLRVPESVGLTAAEGWMTVRADNSGTAAEGPDCYVQGKSRVRVVIDESLISDENACGAAIGGYTVTVGGINVAAPYVSEVLHRSGEHPVVCTLTDTRGRRLRSVQTVTVLPYAPPVIGSASLFRCTEDGTADDEGTCLSLSAGCRYDALDGRNAVTLTARLQPVGGEWSEAVTLTAGESHVLWAGALSADRTYDVELTASDTLGGTASLTVTVPTAKVFFHGRAGGSGGAFGKYAEADDLLEVAWSLKTKGDLTVEGSATIGGKTLMDWLHPVGSVCVCSGDADPAALFGGVWTAADDTAQQWVRTQ